MTEGQCASTKGNEDDQWVTGTANVPETGTRGETQETRDDETVTGTIQTTPVGMSQR